MKRFATVFLFVAALCGIFALPAWAAAQYEVTRWEVNGDYLELDVKQVKEETFSYKVMDDEKSYKMEFWKSLPAGTQLTVKDGWEIEVNPRDVEVKKGKGKSLGEDWERYTKGSTILLKDKTEILFRRLASAPPKRPLEQATKEQSQAAHVEDMELDKRADHFIRWNEEQLSSDKIKLTIEVMNRNSKKKSKPFSSRRRSGGDRCFVFSGLPKNTQFTVPEGWMIDGDKNFSEGLDYKGKVTSADGLRYFGGNPVLLKGNSNTITVRDWQDDWPD